MLPFRLAGAGTVASPRSRSVALLTAPQEVCLSQELIDTKLVLEGRQQTDLVDISGPERGRS